MYSEDLEAASRGASDRANYYLKSTANEHLAHVESCAGNDAAAYEMAKRAVEAAREGDSELTTAIALESFAGYALAAQRIESAIQAADEGLKLLPDDRSHGIISTQLLIRRADAQIRLGNYFEARSSTQAAWKALKPWSSMEDAAGVQFTTARLWRIEAKLRSAEQHAWLKIRQAWEASVTFHRHVIDLWKEDGWVYSGRWLLRLMASPKLPSGLVKRRMLPRCAKRVNVSKQRADSGVRAE
jgi:hypothetical protein